jgi:glycerophosphoryl diester phosphodiesterase
LAHVFTRLTALYNSTKAGMLRNIHDINHKLLLYIHAMYFHYYTIVYRESAAALCTFKLVFILCLVFSVVVHSNSIAQTDFDLPERGLCAHRGAMQTHPENTLPAFFEAVKRGAHMIEFDVQLTADGALVVMHDATVDRTTNGKGKVSELTLDYIRSLDAGAWKGKKFRNTRVPVFEEVLNIMPRNIWLNIHLKGDENLGRAVARQLKSSGRLHQGILAAGEEAALAAREIVPDILICNMNRQSGAWDYVESTLAMGAAFIQLRGDIYPVFGEYVEELHQHSVKVNYFGTDKEEEIIMLFDLGVNFPLVNNIQQSMKYAEKAGIQPIVPQY